MSPRDLRGAAAIVGVAESDLGEVGQDRYAIELAAQAAGTALAEAGLTTRDVDGLFCAIAGRGMAPLDVGEYLGVRPRYTDGTMVGGSSFVSHLHHAALAIAAGACDVALIVYGSTARSDSGRGRLAMGPPELPSYEAAYRPRPPITGYALATARHMHQYGTTRAQLAEVAVAARQWARLNPKAFARDPLTVEDVLAARMVSSPLSTLDCCLVTDGGGAVVVTSAARAADLPRPPVYLLGAGEAHWHRAISQMPDLTVTAATESSARAYAMAGLGPEDVDMVQLYDAFTINTILFLEDLGFCKKGEGGDFVSGGRIAPGGELPVNTNGGGLSYCHPGMYGIFPLIEATRQIRGEAGERQRPGVSVAVAHGNGGQLSSQVTAILGGRDTL
ncbi:thiolase [Sphaerisporangium krabiense]|uniref:Acetyl-CoA acetyltransferase n=1 Tax=Sphaerisporangium krabiense TaxID=763782 RepID=A0A7W8Z2C1_9ACTN|nr:acetyl-CoA acetyltransferase [Sphaerisporangium krabiense]MBB5626157.1 acetyl-CoA acetyltransferase [Sphaerisporangium krabiense]GII66176.1 thiolase [Sphaerisporangium krabiense]